MSSTTYFTGTLPAVTAALAIIDANCGFGINSSAVTWATIRGPAVAPFFFYYFPKPPTSGYICPDGTAVSQSQMINNVVGLVELPFSELWNPIGISNSIVIVESDGKDSNVESDRKDSNVESDRKDSKIGGGEIVNPSDPKIEPSGHVVEAITTAPQQPTAAHPRINQQRVMRVNKNKRIRRNKCRKASK